MKKTVFLFAATILSVLLIAVLYRTDIFSPSFIKASAVLLVLTALLYAVRRHPERVPSGRQRFDRLSVESSGSSLRFSSVAANEEALSSMRELVDYLKNPEKYIRLGARMPRGILLYGPPGTGKTLLARALAGEADVPFYLLSGSDFVQMYAGVGASRVRDLFAKARKAGKCVIFIDEIDALGKKRDDMSSDEREQTLNALLSEMSGFRDTDGVILLAATNRPESLDPALTRPGRFDRQIEVGLPGKSERLDILRLHTENKPISPSVDLDAIASDTVRFSGASLENLMNEAAIRAARRGAACIEQADVDAAYISAVAGADRRPAANRQELAVIALHEAGHAIASLCLLPENRLARVSILPSSSGAAGYNLTIPAEHTVLERRQLCRQLQVLLAGRAAEMLINGADGVTSGAANDLTRAAELASVMTAELGMADEPAVSLRTLQKTFQSAGSDALSRSRALLDEQFREVTSLLESRINELMRLSEALIDRETLSAADLTALLPALVDPSA